MKLDWRAAAAVGIAFLALALLALTAGMDAGQTVLPSDLQAWLGRIQRNLHRALTGAVADAEDIGSAQAFLTLGSVSFLYGVFHAAGPGHGKVLISSFLVAKGAQVRTGILLSFAAAVVNALSAILLVGILAAAFEMGRTQVQLATRTLEAMSYGAIALIGLWLLYGILRGGGHRHDHHHGHHHDHGHDHGRHHLPHDHHGHVHLDPAAVPAKAGWREYAAIAIATGIRPCSGGVLVLLFALAQGMMLVGIASVFVMSLGTGITVAAIATLTLLSRSAALKLAGGGGGWGARLGRLIAAAAALFVAAAGFLMLAVTLGQRTPI